MPSLNPTCTLNANYGGQIQKQGSQNIEKIQNKKVPKN